MGATVRPEVGTPCTLAAAGQAGYLAPRAAASASSVSLGWGGQGRDPRRGWGQAEPPLGISEAPVPCLLALSTPPDPDWLPGLEPAQHWPARLSLGYDSSLSGSREARARHRFLGHPSPWWPTPTSGRGPWVIRPFLGHSSGSWAAPTLQRHTWAPKRRCTEEA